MPTTEYKVYVSSTTLMAEIEEYCEARDISASKAFRDAMKDKLEEDA